MINQHTNIGDITDDQIEEAIVLLRDIHQCLDGVEWSSDTLEKIAESMRAAGYHIGEPS